MQTEHLYVQVNFARYTLAVQSILRDALGSEPTCYRRIVLYYSVVSACSISPDKTRASLIAITSFVSIPTLCRSSVPECEERIAPIAVSVSHDFSFSDLWLAACERPLVGNAVEKSRFEDFMLTNARGRSVLEVVGEYKASLMRHMVEQGRAPRRRARVDGTRLETINEIADRIAQHERDQVVTNLPSGLRGPRLGRAEAPSVDHSNANVVATVTVNRNEPQGAEDPNWCICAECMHDVSKCVLQPSDAHHLCLPHKTESTDTDDMMDD